MSGLWAAALPWRRLVAGVLAWGEVIRSSGPAEPLTSERVVRLGIAEGGMARLPGAVGAAGESRSCLVLRAQHGMGWPRLSLRLHGLSRAAPEILGFWHIQACKKLG